MEKLSKKSEIKNGRVVSINISKHKGVSKKSVNSCLINNFGFKGDAHSGKWHRQVSLLSEESINKMRKKAFNISSGSFAENITTEGIDLLKISIGNRLKIGNDVILEVSQKGKICPKPCSIYYKIGNCIMPKEGVFAKVIKQGEVKVGDAIIVGGKINKKES
ncbi:unnamed protein product [marine sediment metagenome]|uniref:MOSC domain-containing protein n=2 Tax=marine sediment metagenome TaxID=412755 RepID=X0ZQ48_9ZZZZ